MIRPIEIRDLPNCVFMLAALAAEENSNDPTSDDLRNYVNVVEGIIAGHGWGFVHGTGKAMILVNRAPDGDHVVFGLYVHPEYRQSGIAKLLVNACNDEASKRGVPSLQFIVKYGRTVGYYERLGAKPVGTIYESRLQNDSE
jgi:GNAT superfamily N-acetyltransferase